MSEQKWQRSSLRHLMDELSQLGYWLSHTTIARLLKEQKYSLKANVKRLSGSHHPDRDLQFQYIASQRAIFQQAGLPIISVDTKKKELIGNFKNPGQEWRQEATAVNDHDFEQDALGKAVPYGIYDLTHNHGYVYVGQSADTPQFAVEAIVRWWRENGSSLYPNADKILICPMQAAAMVAVHVCGNSNYRNNWQINLDLKSPFATTQQARPSGTRLSIVCLDPSVSIGQASHYEPLRSCSLAFGAPVLRLDYRSKLFWSRRCMRKVSKLPKRLCRLYKLCGIQFVHVGTTLSCRAKHNFKVRSYSFTSPKNRCLSVFICGEFRLIKV